MDITLFGVKTHNLKNINVSLPLGKLTAVTGPSGSGKSSLVFATLFSEARRRYLESFSSRTRHLGSSLIRPNLETVQNLPPAVSLKQDRMVADRHAMLCEMAQTQEALAMLFASVGERRCLICRQAVLYFDRDVIWSMAWNKYQGKALNVLAHLGAYQQIATDELKNYLLAMGFHRLWQNGKAVDLATWQGQLQEAYLWLDRFTLTKDMENRFKQAVDLSYQLGDKALYLASSEESVPCSYQLGLRCESCFSSYEKLYPNHFSFRHPQGACPNCQGLGLVDEEETCPACKGKRLSPLGLSVSLQGRSLADLWELDQAQLVYFFEGFFASQAPLPWLLSLQDELMQKLKHLIALGLDYLASNRRLASLSGGELQRLKIARVLGHNLTQTLYCLDEPCASLHVIDRHKVISALLSLCNRGNTVVCVEHDPLLIAKADHVVELGPGSGHLGGELMPKRLACLVPRARVHKKAAGYLQLKNLKIFNLDIQELFMPIGQITAICGVSGSGKSTLCSQVLVPLLQQAIAEDKKTAALGDMIITLPENAPKALVYMKQARTKASERSIVASFLGVYDPIRKILAKEPRSLELGLLAASFSFNSPGGRCEVCLGLGVISQDLAFLGQMAAICPSCEGMRFQASVASVLYQGKNLAQILDLTIDQAREFFYAHTNLTRQFDACAQLGLGYLTLGRQTNTLSSGELTRLTLLSYVRKRQLPTFFIFDEASYGLSAADSQNLLDFFFILVAEGHTIVLVEHHLDMIKAADYLVELGPKSASLGGKVVFAGPLSALQSCPGSLIKDYLSPAGS